MKTNFNQLSKEVFKFERKAGFDKTSKKQLVKWVSDELRKYKGSKSKSVKSNKLMDIVVLVLQISRREKIDLDAAWKMWWKKSGKYL